MNDPRTREDLLTEVGQLAGVVYLLKTEHEEFKARVDSAAQGREEEIERLEGARALFHSGGAVHHCPLCHAPAASTNIDAERDAIRAAIESKARAESAEKALEAVRDAQADQSRWAWWEGLRDASVGGETLADLVNHRGLIMNSFDAGWNALRAILDAGKGER